MQNLINEFHNMNLDPLFEIELADDEFEIYHIMADDEGLHAGGMSNVGFMPRGITVEWDATFSLDEHLQALFEVCYNNALRRN